METGWHLWSECPALTSTKQSTSKGKDVPMEVEVLQFFKTEPVRELIVLRTNNLLQIYSNKVSVECPPCLTRMGTRWYRPHTHGNQQVFRGMKHQFYH